MKYTRTVHCTQHFCAALLFLLLPQFAYAQASDWPNKQVSIVVPFPPGGALDITAREIALRLTNKYKQPFLVENQPGAGGLVGSRNVAKAKPDGYTLLVASTGQLAIHPAVFKNLQYNPLTDLTPIIQLTSAPFLVAVNADFPGKNARDLVAYIKNNPGKSNYSSTGIGTLVHLSGEMISIEGNSGATHVPFQGGPPSVAAIVGNDVLYTSTNISNPLPLIKAGKLKAIATTGSKRPAELADIPTMQESGFPNFEVTVWVGLFGPKNLPPSLANTIYQAVNETLSDPVLIKKLASVGDEPASKNPQEFAQFIDKEAKKYFTIAKKANIQVD
jgi:tripartite-type tricarboxylate transporter receptor subunit TctC